MESFGEFIAPIQSLLWRAHYYVSGQFMPSTCGWCRPALWIAEAGLVIFFLMNWNPRGPTPKKTR